MPVENNPQTPEDLNANWPLNSDHVKEGAAHIRGIKAVLKALSLRKILAGTGLDGGGDLTADRTLSVKYGTEAGTAAEGNDSRITGALQKSALAAGTGTSTTTAMTQKAVTDALNVATATGNSLRFYASETWTIPTNLRGKVVTVIAQGGGGGGGGGVINGGGGGGGGGGLSKGTITLPTSGTIAVTVGAGGAGGAAGASGSTAGAAGSAGGASAMGTVSAGGGAGGKGAPGAGGGAGGGGGAGTLVAGAAGGRANPWAGGAGGAGGGGGGGGAHIAGSGGERGFVEIQW